VPPGSETHTEWTKILSTNLFSATNMIERTRPMLEKHRGNIVCISSICGIEALGAPVTYSAAKAALNAYIVGVAKTFGKAGIRINGVAPGNILHPGSVWQRRLEADKSGTEAMLQREVALGRLGTPEDVANMCLFLASDRAAFVTGSVFVADGGQLRS
jgi:3-oxoacyl-[acyl-carrier protein] reductase